MAARPPRRFDGGGGAGSTRRRHKPHWAGFATGSPIILAFAVAVLVAYVGAALFQRFLIGQFGIKIGPLELEPVTETALERAVAKLNTSSLGEVIRSISDTGEPSFQRLPLYTDIADPTSASSRFGSS